MKIPPNTWIWMAIQSLEGNNYILSVGKDGRVYRDGVDIGMFELGNIIKGSEFGLEVPEGVPNEVV